MQRSSQSISNLAAALAKAQIELVNPEKSLTATIRSDDAGGTEQTFSYASLSSGLDIVRKTLGQHEIATVQTTSVDRAAGIINLTTVLAHSSGEWIASDWPVCALSETAAPHRMGAALTYARRYALFTLVGIAGEDDHDAPDLATPTGQKTTPQRSVGSGNGQSNGADVSQHSGATPSRRGKNNFSPPILGPHASAELRDRLLADLDRLGSAEEAALWARRSLANKNKLTASDTQSVEDAFQARLKAIAPAADETAAGAKPKRRVRTKAVDKSGLTLPEPRRLRDREHVKFVAKHPCLICERSPADAHHLRFTQPPALGRKVSDEFTVPLCRGHHREVHRAGDEAAWWAKAGIDPTVKARALWLETHPLPNVKGQRRDRGDGRRGKSPLRVGVKNDETKPIAEGARQ